MQFRLFNLLEVFCRGELCVFYESLLSLENGDHVCDFFSAFNGDQYRAPVLGCYDNGGLVDPRITGFCRRVSSGLLPTCERMPQLEDK